MLDPTPLQPGERYGTVADIMACADLPEMPVTPGFERAGGGFMPLWTKSDGSPITILVRAPSFAERRQINQAAGDDDDQFILETCLTCIKDPAFTREQIAILQTKHPAALDQISETAWALASFPAELVAAEVRRLAGLDEKPVSERASANTPKRRQKAA